MASVAEQLRRAREQQKLTVHQVADRTKMRTDHVRALEEGTYDVFSAAVYIRGFVRSYAGMLKLPVAEIMRDLDAELAQTKQFRELPNLAGTSQSPLDRVMLLVTKVNWRVAGPVLALLILALGAIYLTRAWQQRQAKDPAARLGPGLHQASPSVAAEALPLPSPTPALATNTSAPPRKPPSGR